MAFPYSRNQKTDIKESRMAKVKNHVSSEKQSKWMRGSVCILEKIHILFLVPQKTKTKIDYVLITRSAYPSGCTKYHLLSKNTSQIILLLSIMNSTQGLQTMSVLKDVFMLWGTKHFDRPIIRETKPLCLELRLKADMFTKQGSPEVPGQESWNIHLLFILLKTQSLVVAGLQTPHAVLPPPLAVSTFPLFIRTPVILD